jgi:hypothetical protein
MTEIRRRLLRPEPSAHVGRCCIWRVAGSSSVTGDPAIPSAGGHLRTRRSSPITSTTSPA